MKGQGKIIGVLVGLIIIGGWLGVIIGLLLGHLYDIGLIKQWLGPIFFASAQASVRKAYFTAVFTIMGYLAKADGRVSEAEIRVARHLMHQLGLDSVMCREAMHLFYRGKQLDFNWHKQIAQLRYMCRFHPHLLKSFLEIQLQMGYAEGCCDAQKRALLQRMGNELGLSAFMMEQLALRAVDARYRKSYGYQQYWQQQEVPAHSSSELTAAYALLGVTPQASANEIKRAYRRLMSKHHPDKLVARGLTPSKIKLATEQTQKIKSAYEAIKRAHHFQ